MARMSVKVMLMRVETSWVCMWIERTARRLYADGPAGASQGSKSLPIRAMCSGVARALRCRQRNGTNQGMEEEARWHLE
jgi:hypothetical protein